MTPVDKKRKNDYQRAWYAANLELGRKIGRENSQRRYRWWKTYVATLKDKPCLDCGKKFPPECMDFDHVRGRKLFNINVGMHRNASALKKEIAKCELVCSNCHRVRTKKRRSK